MPAIQQSKQPGAGRGKFEESAAEKEAWFALRQYIRAEDIKPGETFQLAGTIAKFLFDGPPEQPRYFVKKQINDKGEEKDWSYIKVLCAVTDPRFGPPGTLTLPPKNVGASFFDGHMGDKPRSPLRGGMFNIHFAVTGAEPPQVLIDGAGDWETDWYEHKPVMLTLKFEGYTPEDSRYAGTKADLAVFVNGFARNRQAARPPDATPDRLEAAAKVHSAADLGASNATERQVKFIYALAGEAGMSRDQVEDWALELFGKEVDMLTRTQASSLIDALQRRRNAAPDPTPAGAVPVSASASTSAATTSDDDETF